MPELHLFVFHIFWSLKTEIYRFFDIVPRQQNYQTIGNTVLIPGKVLYCIYGADNVTVNSFHCGISVISACDSETQNFTISWKFVCFFLFFQDSPSQETFTDQDKSVFDRYNFKSVSLTESNNKIIMDVLFQCSLWKINYWTCEALSSSLELAHPRVGIVIPLIFRGIDWEGKEF